MFKVEEKVTVDAVIPPTIIRPSMLAPFVRIFINPFLFISDINFEPKVKPAYVI